MNEGFYGWPTGRASINSGYGQIDQRLLTAPAGSIVFDNISPSFSSLMLILTGTCDTAGVEYTVVRARFNSDAGAHYDFEDTHAIGGTVNADETLAETFLECGAIGGLLQGSGVAGACNFTITNYTDTRNFKYINGQMTIDLVATRGQFSTYNFSGRWRSKDAITTITLTPGTGKFDVGTRARLYGLA